MMMSFEIDPIKLHSLFEYKDGNLIWKIKNTKGKVAGSLKPTGYKVIEVDGKNIMAHRLVWIMHNGNFEGYIDHIDGNRSNNCIENLRIVDRAKNQWNRKISQNNPLGVKGIRLRKDNNKFEARLTVNGKRIVLGSFKDLELAQLVVMEARSKYHREFANHG
jgi:hypothetical protein